MHPERSFPYPVAWTMERSVFMARKISPFATLTNEEKQIKWMEYQSIRLPYTQVVEEKQKKHEENTPCTEAQETEALAAHQDSQPVPQTSVHPSRPTPPPEVFVTSQKQQNSQAKPHSAYQQMNEYQKSRHRQYDAVIERMKQAEKRANGFCTWSK